MSAKGSVLAIDHGSKRTGFAVSDALRIATHALDTWSGPGGVENLLDHIQELLAERTVETFVVGFPYNMDGTEGGRAVEVRVFVAKLRARFPRIEIVTHDERLSTKAAEDLLRESGHHGEERKKRRDSWSALVILRDWIESGEPR